MKYSNKSVMLTMLFVSVLGTVMSFSFSGMLKAYELILATFFLIVAVIYFFKFRNEKNEVSHIL